MSEAKGILIVGETIEEKIAPITAELLGCGRKLADELGEPLFGALIGSDVSGIAQELIALGADTVYTADNPILQNYQTDTYTQVMEKMCKDISPRYVLMGQTTIGRDLSPRLAFRLNTGLSTDCVDLKIDPQGKGLLQTRPVYGGNAQAIFAVENKYPQIATIRSKAFSPLAPDTTRQGNVIPVAIEIDTSKVKTKFVRKVKEEVTGVKLEDAKAVVTGGRGIGGPDGFKQLEELAAILGGAVGATRPPCDNAWVPSTWQVGLTGKIVTPELYIAVGVSGASQHLAGCSSAKNIVAINKDPDANIFKEARFGVVGDYKQVLPAFTQKIKSLLDK